MQIIILDNMYLRNCPADCGPDWSSPATIELARRRIRDLFGADITLEYIDIGKDAGCSPADANELPVKNDSPSLPMLLVNGNIRIAGHFDIRQVLDTIEIQMEVEADGRGK